MRLSGRFQPVENKIEQNYITENILGSIKHLDQRNLNMDNLANLKSFKMLTDLWRKKTKYLSNTKHRLLINIFHFLFLFLSLFSQKILCSSQTHPISDLIPKFAQYQSFQPASNLVSELLPYFTKHQFSYDNLETQNLLSSQL